MALIHQRGTLEQLVKEAEKKHFADHLFNAKWQHEQFRKMREKPPEHSVVAALDFAENYTCEIQDAAQSYHWNKKPVTIHPIVCFYYNGVDAVCKHDLIFISS